MTNLSTTDLIRYARHLSLREVGAGGQARLKAARVLLVGAGGLGSPAALYLAAAGVGTIGIVDFDRVDVTNLQRQILHGTSFVDRPKVDSAVARLGDLNPEVVVEPVDLRLHSGNALDILGKYDFAIDGSDNFPTRYLVNDASVLLGKPYVYGSILRFEGQVSVFGSANGPCYRCLFSEPPPPDLVPSCAEAGVLGVLPGVIGTLMAVEAIKLILDIGSPLIGRLLLYDALGARIREIALKRDPDCPVCGENPSIKRLIDYEAFCGLASLDENDEITALELAALRDGASGPAILDVREVWEWNIARLDDACLIPLRELPSRVGELDPRREIVALCHRGARSKVAQKLLTGAGFKVRNLTGGIDAWAVDVDPAMPRY